MEMPEEHSPVPICFVCTHYRDNYRCDAFPEGIPFDVVASNADHRYGIEGDDGVHFEPVSELAAIYAEEVFDLPHSGLRPSRRSERTLTVVSPNRDPA